MFILRMYGRCCTTRRVGRNYPLARGHASASAPDIQLLPASLKAAAGATDSPPPIDRTEPAYVKFDLTSQKVTAQLADGVAYDYWTFNGTVPGPMLRVREGDTVEIDLHNAADAGVTHSIDRHAVTGPGGGAKVMQIAPSFVILSEGSVVRCPSAAPTDGRYAQDDTHHDYWLPPA